MYSISPLNRMICDDLRKACPIIYSVSGLRFDSDTSFHYQYRRLIMIAQLAFLCYSVLTSDIVFLENFESNFFFIISTQIFFISTPLSIYCLQNYVTSLLLDDRFLDVLSRLDLGYFRSRMARAVKMIRCLTFIYLLVCFSTSLIALFSTPNSPSCLFVIRSLFDDFNMFMLGIQRGITMYFALLVQNIFASIHFETQDLRNKSDPLVIPVLHNILMVYHSLEEFTMIVEKLASPLLALELVSVIPSIIAFASTVPNSKASGLRLYIAPTLICVALLVWTLMIVAFCSIYYKKPYNAIYQLSFDCSRRRLHKVSSKKHPGRFTSPYILTDSSLNESHRHE